MLDNTNVVLGSQYSPSLRFKYTTAKSLSEDMNTFKRVWLLYILVCQFKSFTGMVAPGLADWPIKAA